MVILIQLIVFGSGLYLFQDGLGAEICHVPLSVNSSVSPNFSTLTSAKCILEAAGIRDILASKASESNSILMFDTFGCEMFHSCLNLK